jgi:hypothetical protein
MKPILVVVGLGMLTAPAVAETPKKNHRETKPTLLASSKTVASKPIEVAPAPAEAPALSAPVAAAAAAITSPAALDIPVLPPDTSSVLSMFPELDKRPMPAVTAKPAKPGKAKPVVLNTGKDYMLGGRRAAKPGSEVEQFIPRSLSQAQVATVVQANMSDIQNCWELVPKAQRADACTAMLNLSISDAGLVTDIELGGDVPAGAHKCITSAVSRWTFPVAETKSEVEYGISLRSL